MLDITLIGCGGVMPLKDRALSSLMACAMGRAVLIDCGEGTQTAARRAGVSFSPVEAVLLTHYHADHVTGLPGLLLTMGLEGRTAPLKIIGPRGLKHVMNAVRVFAPRLPFELTEEELTDECCAFSCAGMEITAFPAQHAVPCVGYAMDLKRGRRFLKDRAEALQVPRAQWRLLQNGQCVCVDGRCVDPGDVLGPPRRGLRVVYCTDSRPVEAAERLARHADLLIHEGMYPENDMLDHAERAGHTTFLEAAQLAARAKPRALILTHFSPSLREPEAALSGAQAVFAATRLGEDGLCLSLAFDDSEAPESGENKEERPE